MMWITLGLILAALLIAYWVWWRQMERRFLQEMADAVGFYDSATDPWEEPQIVATFGGIHDVNEDEWR